MDSLETIFTQTRDQMGEKFFTDKGLPFHSYLSYYDKELAKHRKNVKLLEIGVSWGGSMVLWTKYFEKYKLEGVDITEGFVNTTGNPNKVTFEQDKNINLHLNVNSTDVEFANKTYKNGHFDVIIDDGAHDVPTQFATFQAYFSKLSKKGTYYIEDVLGPEAIKDLMEKIKDYTKDGVNFEIYDGSPQTGRFDDVILKVTRK